LKSRSGIMKSVEEWLSSQLRGIMRSKVTLVVTGVLLAALMMVGSGINPVLAIPRPPDTPHLPEYVGVYGEIPVAGMQAATTKCQTKSTVSATITVDGFLSPGALGLPGETITWVITVSNSGTLPNTDLVVTDTLYDGLHIEEALTERGEAVVSGQTVVFTLPYLHPGETVRMEVRTTVVFGPINGRLVNQVTLAGTSPQGTFAESAVSELFLPTGLPATGYPPDQALPGEGEPSVFVVGVWALGIVLLAALLVWYRGRRRVWR